MLKNKKNTIFFFFLILFQAFTLNASSSKEHSALLNRVILNINKTHYTQRELEVYFFVKKILTKKIKLYELTEKSWPTLLEEFKNDFLVYQSAKEIAFYGKSNEQKESLESFFLKTRSLEKRYKNISAIFALLKPSESELQKALLSYQIIQNFLIRKRNMENAGEVSKEKPLWLLSLEKEAHIRFYKRAGIYESIASVQVK